MMIETKKNIQKLYKIVYFSLFLVLTMKVNVALLYMLLVSLSCISTPT